MEGFVRSADIQRCGVTLRFANCVCSASHMAQERLGSFDVSFEIMLLVWNGEIFSIATDLSHKTALEKFPPCASAVQNLKRDLLTEDLWYNCNAY